MALASTDPTEEDNAAVVYHFRVSEMVVRTTLVNKNLIELQRIEEPVEAVWCPRVSSSNASQADRSAQTGNGDARRLVRVDDNSQPAQEGTISGGARRSDHHRQATGPVADCLVSPILLQPLRTYGESDLGPFREVDRTREKNCSCWRTRPV